MGEETWSSIYLGHAETIAKDTDWFRRLFLKRDQAFTHVKLKQFGNAAEKFQSYVDELENAKCLGNVAVVDIERSIHVMQNLAITQIECGELQMALTVLETTLRLAEKLNNPRCLWSCLLTRGDKSFLEVSSDESCRHAILRGLNLAEKTWGKEHEMYRLAIYRLAALEDAVGDSVKAAELGHKIPPEHCTTLPRKTGFDFSFSSPLDAKKSKKRKKKTKENDESKKPSSDRKEPF